jgi:hypothetical protein
MRQRQNKRNSNVKNHLVAKNDFGAIKIHNYFWYIIKFLIFLVLRYQKLNKKDQNGNLTGPIEKR